jgi:hypothetical protein
MPVNRTKNASITLSFLFVVSNVAAAYGQTGANAYFNPPSSLSGKTVVIPSGTTLEGRLESTIGSSVSKMGERFNIELTSPALANGTDVLIPAGSKIVGEVVEAVPSGKVTHDKKEHPFGKLRVQITNLRMPDGTTFPMIGSIVGENNFGGGYNPDLGGGVAFTGNPNNFNAVAPGKYSNNPYQSRHGMPSGPHVVTRREAMSDPIVGNPGGNQQGMYSIRSLIKKKRNLFIYKGSPLTVRLDAPMKMGIGVARNAGVNLEAPTNPDAELYPGSGHRRFSPDAQPEPQANPPAEQFDPARGIFGGTGSRPVNTPPGGKQPQPDSASVQANPGASSPALPFQVPNRSTPAGSNSQDSNF